MALTESKDFLRKMLFFVKKSFITKMSEGVGLDTQGKRSTSFLESIGTGPDRSFRCKQDSRAPQESPFCFRSLNTVTGARKVQLVSLLLLARVYS